MDDDEVTQSILQIKSQLPEPRRNLSLEEKLALIAKVGGPRTARSILKAAKELPRARIPFLFNSLCLQSVIDILENDMEAALSELDKKSL